MTTTYNDNGGSTPNGSIKNFTFTFPYLKTEDVKVSLNGVTQATTKYTVNVGVSPTRIEFNDTDVTPGLQTETTGSTKGAPLTGVTVRVYRDTDVDSAKAVFAAGSSIRAQNLNDNQDQVLYALQEEQTQPETLTDADINPAAEIQVSKLKDGTARQLLQTDAAGTGVEWSSNIDVPGTLDVTGAVDFDSNLNVDGTLTVDGVSTLTGNVTVGGTVDGRDVAADGSKLDGIETAATADQTNAEIRTAVEAASDSNVFTDADHTKLNAIEANAKDDQTASEIKTLYESNSDTNEFSDAEQTKLAGIDVGAKDDQTAAEIRVAVEAASDSNVFTDADHTKLNAIEASADVTDATNVDAAGAVMNADTTTAAMQFVIDEDNFSTNSATKVPTQQSVKAYSDGIVTAHILDEDNFASDSATKPPSQQSTKAYITATSQPLDAQLTTLAGSTSGTASIIGDGSKTLTSNIDELNLLDGKSIITSISGSATDVQLPSAQAVNERIVELVTEVGGFHPIANETSFPSTNPDINDGAGTIVSVKALASAFTLGSGVTTKVFTNGAGSGVNVTVNGLTQSTTYPAGRGMLLETTSTLHTYNYHRLTLDEAGVASAQAAIDDYDERYYGPLGSAPGTRPGGGSRVNGDMYFDTTAYKMKVFNASTSAWDDVATSASSFISTLSPAFDSSETEFTASSVPIDAQSCIISINGVIQKPNSGTSTPSEGYVQLANDKIKFATAPTTGADYFMITLGNAVSIGTPSPNTVGASQLQSNAVERAKIAADAIDGTKIADDAVGAEHIEDLDADVKFLDTAKIVLGTGNDCKIHFNGTNTVVDQYAGTFEIAVANASEYAAKFIPNGAVELYYDNAKKLETSSTGVELPITANNTGIKLTAAGSHYGSINFDSNRTSENHGIGWIAGKWNGTDVAALSIEAGDDTTNKDDGKITFYTGQGGTMTRKMAIEQDGTIIIDDGDLEIKDDKKIKLGDSNDLEIYHDGNSKITHTGAGDLAIGAGAIQLESENHGELLAKFTENGAVELRYDNVKKFETTTHGTTTTGNSVIDGDVQWNGSDGSWGAYWDKSANIVSFKDSKKIGFGTSNDLQIYHDGGSHDMIESNSTYLVQEANNIIFRNLAGNEDYAKFLGNGAVELYYDNSKKLETTSDGATVSGNVQIPDNNFIKFGDTGTADFYIGHNPDNSCNLFRSHSSNIVTKFQAITENMVVMTPNAAVELYYDGSKKFETASTGCYFDGHVMPGTNGGFDLGLNGTRWGDVYIKDSKKIKLGDSNDLEIYHDGSDSWIKDTGTGNLNIATSSFAVKNAAADENMIVASQDAAVELYHNNFKSCETIGNGLQLYGPEGGAAQLRLFADEGDDNADKWMLRAPADGTCDISGQGSGSTWKKGIRFNQEAATELFYDNVQQMRTHGNGIFTRGIYPITDNTFDIGSGSERYDDIFATNGTINTSDRNEKNTIIESDLGLNFVNKLNPISYKWNKDDGKTHYGLIAQELETALADEGKTNKDFAGLNIPSKGPMGINYSELISPLIKAVKELSSEVETLKTKVAALEAT